ncbi:MAG: hypothetical protein HY558_01280 [Euryarchaeota archaeon]|nr:hypothetical protein [Euryarchaeota archaeon]
MIPRVAILVVVSLVLSGCTHTGAPDLADKLRDQRVQLQGLLRDVNASIGKGNNSTLLLASVLDRGGNLTDNLADLIRPNITPGLRQGTLALLETTTSATAGVLERAIAEARRENRTSPAAPRELSLLREGRGAMREANRSQDWERLHREAAALGNLTWPLALRTGDYTLVDLYRAALLHRAAAKVALRGDPLHRSLLPQAIPSRVVLLDLTPGGTVAVEEYTSTLTRAPPLVSQGTGYSTTLLLQVERLGSPLFSGPVPWNTQNPEGPPTTLPLVFDGNRLTVGFLGLKLGPESGGGARLIQGIRLSSKVNNLLG